MAVVEFKKDGTYGWVTCLNELPHQRGVVRLMDRIPADQAQEMAYDHDREKGGKHRVSFGRQNLEKLDPETTRLAFALQEARMRRTP